MKIVFDTNVYVAEALLGEAAEEMIRATFRAQWRVFVSEHILVEAQRVLIEKFQMPKRFAVLTRQRIVRRALLVKVAESIHRVPADLDDTDVLRTAVEIGADYLITNDRELLALTPYQGISIISMTEYYQLLEDQGILT